MSSSDRNERNTIRASSSIAPAVNPQRFPVCQELDVLWSDLDALGNVSHLRYFAWLEDARIAYFRMVGIELAVDAIQKPVVASTSMDFLRPVYYPDRVRVEGKVTRIGRTSLTMDYRVTSIGQQAVVATGSAVIVLLAAATSRPGSIPDAYRDAIRRVDPDARETL